MTTYAVVAQWIERFPPEEEVGGSSPFSRATSLGLFALTNEVLIAKFRAR